MAAEASGTGSGSPDARIGESLIKEVIEGELRAVPSEHVPPLNPLVHQVQTEQEKMMVDQLAKLTKLIGDKLRDDVEFKQFNDTIDNLVKIPGCKLDQFQQVTFQVFEDSITWERIILLFYAAGRLAVKLVEFSLPSAVWEIAKWIVDFFRKRLLGWIHAHGGWMNSFSELAAVPLRSVRSGPVYGVVLFMAGLALGCVITCRMHRHQ